MNSKKIDIATLTYLEKYAKDVHKREKLFPLFERVFGIKASTLADFSNRGLWNDDYMPYTFFVGDLAVANVSAFPLAMKINGENTNCIGIQSVMTDPDYRRNGLMKILFQKMLDDIDKTYESAFLYTSSPELYTPFGFKVIKQHYFKKDYAQPSIKPKHSLTKLEPLTDLDDLKTLTEVFKKRDPLSNIFSPLTYLGCLYFNLYNPWIYEKFFFIDELKTIIVFEVLDGTLRIFDMIAETVPSLEELCSSIPSAFHTIEFYFNPDIFNLVELEAIEFISANKLMARGSLQLENKYFMMPLTSEF